MNHRACWVVVAALAALPPHPARADFLVGSWQSLDVRRFADDGSPRGVFIDPGSGGLTTPDGLAYGPDGHLYVSSAEQAAVLRFNGQTGAFMDVFASTGLTRAGYCAFGPDGLLYVCSAGNDSVVRFNPSTGAFIDRFITSPTVAFPAGLAWAGDRILVSSFGGSGGVHAFNAATGAPLGQLTPANQPLYLRVAGPDELHIAEFGANRIKRVSLSTGAQLGTFGGIGLNGPVGLLLMPDGTQLVTSWNNGRVLRYSATGSLISIIVSGYPQANDIVSMPIPAPGSLLLLPLTLAGLARRRR